MKSKTGGIDKWGRVWRSAKQRQELIRAYEGSGLSKAAFCRQRGISVTTFYGWLKKRPASPTQFAEVEMAGVADVRLSPDCCGFISHRIFDRIGIMQHLAT